MSTSQAQAGDHGKSVPFTAWWAVTIFFLSAILSYSDRYMLGILIDPIRADLRISDTEISLLQGAAFAIFYVLMSIPLGRAADVFSRRWLIVMAMIGWTVAAIFCGLAQDFQELFLARVLVGIGEAALMPAGMSMIGDLFPPSRRGAAVGIFSMGMVGGSGVASFAGGHIFDAVAHGALAGLPLVGGLEPWRATLILSAFPGLLLAMLVLTIREPSRLGSGHGSARLSGREVFTLLKDRRAQLIPLYLAMSLMNLGLYCINGWVPSLLIREYGLSRSQVGTTFGSITIIAGILGAVGGGMVSDRLVKRHGIKARFLFAAAVGTICVAAGTLGVMPSLDLIYLLLPVWIFCAIIFGTVGNTIVVDLLPNQARGVGMAIATVCNTLVGMAAGPTLVALFNEHVYGSIYGPGNHLGLSITTVIVPAAAVAALMLLQVYRATASNNVGTAPERRFAGDTA